MLHHEPPFAPLTKIKSLLQEEVEGFSREIINFCLRKLYRLTFNNIVILSEEL